MKLLARSVRVYGWLSEILDVLSLKFTKFRSFVQQPNKHTVVVMWYLHYQDLGYQLYTITYDFQTIRFVMTVSWRLGNRRHSANDFMRTITKQLIKTRAQNKFIYSWSRKLFHYKITDVACLTLGVLMKKPRKKQNVFDLSFGIWTGFNWIQCLIFFRVLWTANGFRKIQ